MIVAHNRPHFRLVGDSLLAHIQSVGRIRRSVSLSESGYCLHNDCFVQNPISKNVNQSRVITDAMDREVGSENSL